MTPHSPTPSQTLPPHRSQPGFPVAVSNVLFGEAIYFWHRNRNTARAGTSKEGSQQNNSSILSPQCSRLQVSLTLPPVSSAPAPLRVHPAGWQHLSLSPLLCCPNSVSTHLAGSPFLIPQLGLHPELNLCISDPLPGPDLFLNTSLGCFVMLQSSCGAGEVLMVPQAWRGNQVLPVLV